MIPLSGRLALTMINTMQVVTRLFIPWLIWGLSISPVQADISRPGENEFTISGNDPWRFKLTPTLFSSPQQPTAADLNLRMNHGNHAFWLGYYEQKNVFEQGRTGYEYTLNGRYGRLIPSLQLATHGVAGTAVNAEIGLRLYALLGYGRTNARTYYNLNFDPNDAITLGAGIRPTDALSLLLYRVRDNRLHTEQSVNHFVLRYDIPDHQRLTVDIFEKHGRASPDESEIYGKGTAVTYDYHQVFVRLTHDNRAGFSLNQENRVSLGLRF